MRTRTACCFEVSFNEGRVIVENHTKLKDEAGFDLPTQVTSNPAWFCSPVFRRLDSCRERTRRNTIADCFGPESCEE
jgi:hypothetical protein